MPTGDIKTPDRTGAGECSWCSKEDLPPSENRTVCERCRNLLLGANLSLEEIYGPVTAPETSSCKEKEGPMAASKCCGSTG